MGIELDLTFEGDVHDYRRAVNKRSSGRLAGQIKDDPAMSPAIYRCSAPDCKDRILVGIRNKGHIKYAVQTIQRCGWVYRGVQRLLCPEHSYLASSTALLPAGPRLYHSQLGDTYND